MDHLDAGRSVLVSAPTGSGKTVVADYAVHLGLTSGTRVFYTTPIKALSNQKYGDLRRRHGASRVGLLTGDNSINPEASVVVMTTEVLRNMIHAEPARLCDLAYVVLDEVHYLEDRYRGGVWEEVILGAPPAVSLVCLSATVANADQLAAWIEQVRGPTGVVVESRRPIELVNCFAIGDRSAPGLRLLPVLSSGRPNREAIRLDDQLARPVDPSQWARRPTPGVKRGGHHARPRIYRPRRSEVVEHLDQAELLPAIYFIFSRAGCEDAVRRCLEDGLRLTSPDEAVRIRAIVDAHLDPLSDDDLAVLDYPRFAASLESGFGAHHAGMVPPFREAVEACFSEALVKVVFATETLALGINMPARSVVLEEIHKFTGAGHRPVTASEYTQLTGRAGRRGIDVQGHGIVVASARHRFEEVARLVSGRPRALTSSFRPTYNLAVNLVRRFTPEAAYTLVTSSFAQFLSESDLAGELDAVISILTRRGYLDRWSVTERGLRLAGVYHEADLLVAESIEAGVFDDLSPSDLAAVASGFCYEARRERDGPAPAVPEAAGERLEQADRLSSLLADEERTLLLPVTRGVDAGFAAAVAAWADGLDLRRVLGQQNPAPKGSGGPARPRDSRSKASRASAAGASGIRAGAAGSSGRHGPSDQGRHQNGGRAISPGSGMSPGDFVRNVKQVIDLLRQLQIVAPVPETAANARAAARALSRDLVASSSLVTVGLEHGTIRAGATAEP